MLSRIVFVLAILAAIGRVLITPRLTNIPTPEGLYEAFTHLFVGFLLIVPAYDWKQQLGPSRMCGLIGLALSLWELAWFLLQKAHVL